MSHPTEPRRGGLWAGWQITGHSCCHRDCHGLLRWITHHRSSVNHQSPLTSHHRHQHPLPPPQTCIVTHTHTRTLEEDTAQNLTGDKFCWRINSNCENAASSYILLLSVYQPSSFLPLLSHLSQPHTSLHLSVQCQPSFFVTCASPSPMLCFPFLFSASSTSYAVHLHPIVLSPKWYISLLCLSGHLAAQHHRASKSLLTF